MTTLKEISQILCDKKILHKMSLASLLHLLIKDKSEYKKQLVKKSP